MKCAMIIGSEGQDGRILFDRLSREQAVIGIGRDGVRSTDRILPPVDILNAVQVRDVIDQYQPAEIYFLAAFHQSSQEQVSNEVQTLRKSYQVHVHALRNVLDGVIGRSASSRVFYAASSYIFGTPTAPVQDETTPMKPESIYGITKAAGVEVCRLYRTYDLFASVGILYNHESGNRPESFVAQKIVSTARRIKAGSDEKLVIGDLSARVDWGYAPDYVDAMIRILRLPQPDDFIIATGETHTVREFVEVAFGALGLDWKSHVVENPALIGSPKPPLVGNPDKLKRMTGWRPSVTFEQMVRLLVGNA